MALPARSVGLGILAVLSTTSAARADLFDYIKKADDSYSWKLESKDESESGTVYHLRLVSQTWQKIKWEHDLVI